MNSLLEPALDQIRDIRGLDPLPWWPLAPGWWVMLGFLAAAVVAGLLVAWWVYVAKRDWRSDARHRLRELALRAPQLGAKEVAAQLAALLRRIAMARYGRRACASLTGEEWLIWLSVKDPAGFAWAEQGRILIELPYAPPRAQVHASGSGPDHLRALFEAVLPWLEQNPQPQPVGGFWARWKNGQEKVAVQKIFPTFPHNAIALIRLAHVADSQHV